MSRLARLFVLSLLALTLSGTGRAQDIRAAPHGMVAAQESRAARIGVAVLEKGGNAVDAAVAVAFAMAVTHPQAGNIGGGGFMLIHLADRNADIAIDYREAAPGAVTRDVFLDERGEADPRKSRDSALGVGVPGTVAGMAHALARYGSGKFTLRDLIEPAIALARDGIDVSDDLADSLPRFASRLSRWPAAAKIFLDAGGAALKPGSRLVQADLAQSLTLIARDGPQAFYDGPVGAKIVASLVAAGGIMTLDDLRGYRVLERPVVRGTYRGFDIVSMPLPSSGGTGLIEMLNILEGFRLGGEDAGRAAHLKIEAMKLAYADRAEFLGDPDATAPPPVDLTSKAYAAKLRNGIGERARPAATIRAGQPSREGDQTTHFSVIDRFGNAVSNTYTLNFSYGLGMVADGTGILLNNELDDFAAKPGAPNAYGLVGGAANAPGPGKRPLSSMSPTLVLKDGTIVLVAGSPGGSRIITITLQTISNVLDFGMRIDAAVAAPRLHNQWLPDRVETETGFPPDVIRLLEGRGHKIVTLPPWGSANSIQMTPDGPLGGADPRTRGSLAVGY